MIRKSIAAAALVLAAAATPSFAGSYDNDGSTQYDSYGRYHGGYSYDRSADGDHCFRRWGSYERRIVRHTYDSGNYGGYNTNYGSNYSNYGSDYGRRNNYTGY